MNWIEEHFSKYYSSTEKFCIQCHTFLWAGTAACTEAGHTIVTSYDEYVKGGETGTKKTSR